MKKFRFETIHLIMMGMILFGILAICIRLMQTESGLIVVIFLACLVMTALLYFQKESYQLNELEKIELLNDQTEMSLKTLLDKMPVGVLKFNPEENKIDWYNPYAQLIFINQETGQFDYQTALELMAVYQKGNSRSTVEIAGNYYKTYVDSEVSLLYFFDANKDAYSDQKMLNNRPVIGIISVDNYDDLTDNLADADISQINSFIVRFMANFTEQRAIYYRRVAMDRFYFFTDYATLETLMSDKFTILDQFREEAQEQELSLTLSMGISFGYGHHDQIGTIAQQNLNIALVRGGDQVVIKENADHTELLYFGGGTVSTIKRSRTRTRAMMTAISDKLKTVQQVFIVGHKNLDMDALGAAVGMQFFAQSIVAKAYVVYNPDELGLDVKRAVERLKAEDSVPLLTVKDALKMVSKRSLLVMVDHSKTQLTLSKELFDRFKEVIVVDHHRRDEDFPDNAVLTFIESGASSASELVSELIQFQNQKENRLTKLQASLLMAGIMLDTHQFSTRVTSRTFDVASYLRSLGSDSVDIQAMIATDFDEYRQVNELILRAKSYHQMMIAKAANDSTYSNVTTSKAADKLLEMADVKASFVLSRNPAGHIQISARSRHTINVQRIMEKMGGGGHFNLAACQFEDKSLAQAEKLLMETIATEIEEE